MSDVSYHVHQSSFKIKLKESYGEQEREREREKAVASLMFKVYRHQLLIQSHAMNFVNYHEIFPLIILDTIFNNPRAMFWQEYINRYFMIWHFDDEVIILHQYGNRCNIHFNEYIFYSFVLRQWKYLVLCTFKWCENS